MVDNWKKYHPDIPFPDPKNYPHMYDNPDKIPTYVDYVDPLNYECTSADTCPRGLLDYECQIKHSCYLNLAQLFMHLLAFGLILIIGIIVAGYLFRILYKTIKGVVSIHRVFSCIAGCLQCCSLGLFEHEIFYGTKKKKPKVPRKVGEIQDKLRKYEVELNYERLDRMQIDRIHNMVCVYEIVD